MLNAEGRVQLEFADVEKDKAQARREIEKTRKENVRTGVVTRARDTL